MRKNLVEKMAEVVKESITNTFWKGFQPRYESGRILFGSNGHVGIGCTWGGDMRIQITLPESVVENMMLKYTSKTWDSKNDRTESVKVILPTYMIWGKEFEQRKFRVVDDSISVTYRADGVRITVNMNKCTDCIDEERRLILGEADIFVSDIQIKHNARKLLEHMIEHIREESRNVEIIRFDGAKDATAK